MSGHIQPGCQYAGESFLHVQPPRATMFYSWVTPVLSVIPSKVKCIRLSNCQLRTVDYSAAHHESQRAIMSYFRIRDGNESHLLRLRT